MANAYRNFPAGAPVDVAKRHVGKCDCGRCQDSTEKMKVCSISLIIEITYLYTYLRIIYI